MQTSTEKIIFDTCRAEGLPVILSNLVTAQSKHESDDYTSNIFKTCNNCFGYKYVGQALATQGLKSPENDYYAKYATVADSAKELARWILRRVKEKKFPADLTTIKSPKQYAELLKACGYYGDNVKNYTAGITKFFKDYSTGISAAAILIAGAALFFFSGKA